ncbi:MAG TPA: ATP-binding protein [Acidimicrobiia bacterium]|nr:ATP-binding protein [Acidimicrobiia bacterium]
MNELPGDQPSVGRVIGTEDSTPLEFWVAVAEGQYLQLDDVVALERVLPGGEIVAMYGMVSQVRARHEGARFDSDVFLIEDGVLPAEVAESAKIAATRFEPETFVPPRPGQLVRRAIGEDRDKALFFDRMDQRLPIGLSRAGEPLFANLEFLDGRRGAHVNISGISGVATKTTYATFLLHSIFTSGVLGPRAVNTTALIFNVKGEDLLFLDRPNSALDADEAGRYGALGLPSAPFASLSVYAPPRPGSVAAPDVYSRTDGVVTSFFWTLQEFCHDDLLPFLFADAEDDRAQYTMVVHNVMAQLRKAVALDDGAVMLDGETIRTFDDLTRLIQRRVTDEETRYDWAGPAIGQGTVNAFVRRLLGAVRHVERLIRGDVSNAGKHQVNLDSQVTVVDIHNLNDRAKRFVVGVTIRRQFEFKERSGQSDELLFLVLDELNKYAPRDGSSPIKEILLDVAERGRSLGIILIGAQQTASEIERRIIANSSIRVVGRLDSAEAAREEYGFLPVVQRQRSTILKPGTMIVSQPELPVPLVLEFPFPAWATRASEATPPAAGTGPDDPFEGLDR